MKHPLLLRSLTLKAFFLVVQKKGGDRNKQRPPTICNVSRVLRDLSESPFNPQLVSIGPIHREDEKLQEFEWLKECYLDDLLHRCDSTPENALEECLVMDGCFILEFCFKHEDRDLYLPNKIQNIRIAMDLLLLENQVPFFVLQALFDCSMGKMSFTLSHVLDTHLAPYFKLFSPLLPEKNSTTIHFDSDLLEKISTTDVDLDSTHDHLLGYLHRRCQLVAAKSLKPHAGESKLVAAKSSNPIHSLKPKLVAAKSLNPICALISKLVDKKGSKNTYTTFHSIVELDRSGMNFKSHQGDEWSMTIKFQSSFFACFPWFWSNPTLLMPTLVIHDFTELILRNLIAYEQSFPQDRYYFTSYTHAMDMLIDTQEDIAKLLKSKVLVNTLGSNQEAADMINKVCKNITITEFYYSEEFTQIDKYYNALWPKHMALLRRVYFNNPWNVFALLAAIILFSLTVVQTIYAIKGK
ncbi:putative UPF0481 protein [Tanacetum coccineum]|uniref:UPF0481 protein n=1 Tax=Tanacetum coccineum TaxID=301880 RepID=A0ABQ5JGB6_9ASTR